MIWFDESDGLHGRLTGAFENATTMSNAPPRSIRSPASHVGDLKYCSTTSRFKMVSFGRLRVPCFCNTLPMLLPLAASRVMRLASHI